MQHTTLIPHDLLLTASMDPSFIARFCLFVAVLLIGSVLVGKILKHYAKLPTIAGYIIGGIIMGPSSLDIASWPFFAQYQTMGLHGSLTMFSVASSELFIFCIMVLSASITVSYLLWIAGHETDIKDIINVGTTALSAGFLGAVIPIIMIFLVMLCFSFQWSITQAAALGLIFAATSVSIPVAMLFSYNKMHLKSSKATLGAAVIDDIVAVILVSLFFLMVQSGFFGEQTVVHSLHHASLANSLISMAVTFIILMSAGYYLIPPFIRLLKKHQYSHIIPLVASLSMFLYFAFSEIVGGIAGITGAYFAGLFHRMGDKDHEAEKTIAPFVNSFLLPLFLCSIGLTLNIHILSFSDWMMVILILAVAIISKLVACFAATGMSNWIESGSKKSWTVAESFVFGSAMVARGEVGLVVATILYGSHMLNQNQYSIAVVTIVLTTIIAPIMLSTGFAFLEKDPSQLVTTHLITSTDYGLLKAEDIFLFIKRYIESSADSSLMVHISDNNEIISVENKSLEIIYHAEKGIICKGRRTDIHTILDALKQRISQDIKHISTF